MKRLKFTNKGLVKQFSNTNLLFIGEFDMWFCIAPMIGRRNSRMVVISTLWPTAYICRQVFGQWRLTTQAPPGVHMNSPVTCSFAKNTWSWWGCWGCHHGRTQLRWKMGLAWRPLAYTWCTTHCTDRDRVCGDRLAHNATAHISKRMWHCEDKEHLAATFSMVQFFPEHTVRFLGWLHGIE